MWARLTLGAVLAATGLTGSCATHAAATQSDRKQTVNLERSIALTIERNPELVAFGFQLDAQRGRIRQAGLRPNPELGLELENLAGTDTFSGVDSVEATIGLTWILERGKQRRRTDVARAGLSLLGTDADVRRLDAAAETARIYLECLEYQALLELTDEAVQLSRRTVEAARKRVEAGRSPPADLARAEVALSEQQLALEDYSHSLTTALHRLSAQWGDNSPSFARVEGNASTLPVPISYEQLRERVDSSPDLGRYMSEKRLREAEVRLARSRARPNWRVNVGVRHLERTGDQALVAGITIPLATRNRNEGRIAETRAVLAMSDASREAAKVRVETQLFESYQELVHALHVAEKFRDEILPRVERALRETERAYEAGRYSYLEMRSAQDDALNARTAAIVAAIDANRNLIEIERLTGAAVTTFAGGQ